MAWTAGPFLVPNPTPVPEVDSGPECRNPVQPCDDFTLTVSLPSDYKEQNPDKLIKFSAGWTDTGSGSSDYDLYVYQGVVTTTDGSQGAYTQSASGADPETTSIPVFDGTRTFTVKVVPYTPTAETVNVSAALVDGAPSGGAGGGGGGVTTFGGPTPTAPGVPRYQTLAAPDGSAANSSSGEFNIGFDPKTGNMMTSSYGSVFRVTPPELRSPKLPEAGPAEWTDVSAPISSATSLDPILVTDQTTGRTFLSNLTAGANALFAYTDDDGSTWHEGSVAPPDGGVDHETLGTGPYPAQLSALGTVYPNALYYCSQGDVPDWCQRSDSGGVEFGPGTPAASGVDGGCSSLHGHVKVAPNGTVYLPNKDCGTGQGGSISTDAGTTWSEFTVPNSGTMQTDPSIGIDSDSTAYYCYAPNDGSMHVAVSHDNGKTWTDDHDIGGAVGVKQSVFPEAVGGSSGRASCGFLGTDQAGNFGSAAFDGKWYLYIATTYDGGKTWTTVNATPNDPVQGAGGICTSGIGCTGGNRNLLDFNEVTIDDRGRVLFGYDDGCVTDRCLTSGGEQNDFVAYARIARQTGGKPLYAKYDPVEPAAPKQPYAYGTRDQDGAVLKWNAPDNGGSDITSYEILRGTTSGSETQVATVSGDKSQYVDTSVSPTVSDYYYEVVAVNAQGSSVASNEADLRATVTAPPANQCEAPGPTILTDASGDSLTGTPGTDLHSLEVSQQTGSDGGVDLRFQLDTDPGMNPQLPQSSWYVSFKETDGSVHGVRMYYDPANPLQPAFESYVASANSSGAVDGRFITTGTEQPADASSSYDTVAGTVTIVVPASQLGLKAGDAVLGFNAASVQSASTPVGGAAEALDSMPDSLAYTGSFTVKSAAGCSPDTPPTAALKATPLSGDAPLQVAFDASGSTDPDQGDSVASYTFDFGDGSAPVTQASPTVSHTYASSGIYTARVTAKDTRDGVSTNDASVRITATNPPVVFEDDDAHIAYDNGWHTVSDSDASAGHFRTSNGKGMSFAFSTSTANGSVVYYFATSSKGGSADVYLDGSLVKNVSFAGSGKATAPTFGSSLTVALPTSGSHTLALKNAKGVAYVDKITVTDGVSEAKPATSPGQTSSSSGSVGAGQSQTSQTKLPANATGLAVLVESGVSVPYTVAVLSTTGSVLATAKSDANGVASLELPATGGATYLVKLVDVGLVPLDIWSAVTPQIENG